MLGSGRRRLIASIGLPAVLALNLAAGMAAVRVAAATPALTPSAFTSPPIAVGGNHTCALPGDGTVLCWGDNTFGQVGSGRVTDPTAPAGDVLVQQTVIADAAGEGVGECVDVAVDGAVIRCHGSTSLTGAVAIAAGFSHTCALLADSTVKCWGSNAPIDGGLFGESLSGGELGDGSTIARSAPVTVIAGPGQVVPLTGVRALSAAAGYTCALLDDGSARCWGNAPQAISPAPVTVTAEAGRPLTQIASISAGDRHACALLLDSSVVCWGSDANGLLGDQDQNAQGRRDFPVSVTVAGAPSVDLGGIDGISVGHNVFNGPNGFGNGHSCALSTGEVLCWGINDVSQLGNGEVGGFESSRDYAVPVIAAPGSSALLAGVTAIAAGGYFTCALIDDGSVRCWGLGLGGDSFEGAGAPVPLAIAPNSTATSNGGVGLVAFTDRSALTAAAAPLASVVAIAAGGGGICAILANGSLWCSDAEFGMAVVPGVMIAASSGSPTTDLDGLVGDWNTTYGAPTTLTISYADGSYAMTATAPVQVVGAACSLPVGTVIATFAADATGKLVGRHGLWSTTNCVFAQWTPMSLVLDASGGTLTASMGNGEVHPFTRAAPAPTPSPAPAPTASPSVAGPEGVVGDWLSGRFHVAFSDGLYSAAQVGASAGQCPVAAGTVVGTFSGSGGIYTGQELSSNTGDCSASWIPATYTFDGTTLTIASAQAETVVWQRTSGPSLFRNSIPTPAEVNLDLVTVVLPTLVVGAGIIVLVPFPGALFNSTLRTNYAEIMRRGRRGRRRLRNLLLTPWFALRARLALTFGPQPLTLGEETPILAPPPATEQRHDFWWTLPGVGVFIVLTALLSGFLDPDFGLDTASIATFVGMLVGLVLVLVAFDVPSFLFYRRRAIRFWPRALPATIVVSLACVLLSRLTDFHPGYLYGLIVTVAVATSLEPKDEGRLLAVGTTVTIGVAVVAWLALGVVTPAAATSADPLLIAGQTVLSMIVADGVQLAAFGMLPLSVLAGAEVRKWNPWVHAGLWLFGIATFGIIILNPQNGYLSDTTRTPLLTIVALLVLFSVGSIWFWGYFLRWHKRMARLAPAPVPADEHSR